MNKQDATEVAYNNGFKAGKDAAAKRILSGIGERLQKARFSNMKERFLILDLIKSYEEEYKGDECGMHIRVPYNVEIGQKEQGMSRDKQIEEMADDISLRGFWISGFVPPERDHGDFIGWYEAILSVGTRWERLYSLHVRKRRL